MSESILELGIESRESNAEVFEESRAARRGLLKEILQSKIADYGLNFVPGFDIVKLSIEAALAKTSSGSELSPRQRLNYVAIAGATLLSYSLLASGMPNEAALSRGSATLISAVEFGPKLYAQGIAKAKRLKAIAAKKWLSILAGSAANAEQSSKFYNILNLELAGANAE